MSNFISFFLWIRNNRYAGFALIFFYLSMIIQDLTSIFTPSFFLLVFFFAIINSFFVIIIFFLFLVFIFIFFIFILGEVLNILHYLFCQLFYCDYCHIRDLSSSLLNSWSRIKIFYPLFCICIPCAYILISSILVLNNLGILNRPHFSKCIVYIRIRFSNRLHAEEWNIFCIEFFRILHRIMCSPWSLISL